MGTPGTKQKVVPKPTDSSAQLRIKFRKHSPRTAKYIYCPAWALASSALARDPAVHDRLKYCRFMPYRERRFCEKSMSGALVFLASETMVHNLDRRGRLEEHSQRVQSVLSLLAHRSQGLEEHSQKRNPQREYQAGELGAATAAGTLDAVARAVRGDKVATGLDDDVLCQFGRFNVAAQEHRRFGALFVAVHLTAIARKCSATLRGINRGR